MATETTTLSHKLPDGMTRKVLVLNADYMPISITPLHVISTKRAITRVYNGTATVVDTYDQTVKTKNPKYRLAYPSVIARTEFLNRARLTVGTANHNLYYRDMCKCAYCNVPLVLGISPEEDHYSAFTVDHVIPQSKGGTDAWENIVSCCPACNTLKGNQMPTGRWKPNVKLYAPSYGRILHNRRHFPITVHHESWIPWLGEWHAEIRIKE